MCKVTAFSDENIKSFVCNDKEMCEHLLVVASYNAYWLGMGWS